MFGSALLRCEGVRGFGFGIGCSGVIQITQDGCRQIRTGCIGVGTVTVVTPSTFLYLCFDIIQSHDSSPTQHQNGDNTQGHYHTDNDNWWVFFCTHLHLHLQLIMTNSSPMTRRMTGSKSHHSEDGSQPARQCIAIADWQPMAARPTVTTAHSLQDITLTTMR